MHRQHMLLQQQLPAKNIIPLRNLNPRKRIKRSQRRNATHPRSCLAPSGCHIPPRPHSPPHIHQMILRTFQRRLNRILHRLIRREPRPQQLMHAIHIRRQRRRVAANDPPANPPPWRQIIFRQPAKRHTRHIRSDAGKRHMFHAIIQNQLVVNLIRKHHKIVLARQLGNFLQLPPRIQRPSRIIRIDQHNPPRQRRNLLLDILHIRLPRVVFI